MSKEVEKMNLYELLDKIAIVDFKGIKDLEGKKWQKKKFGVIEYLKYILGDIKIIKEYIKNKSNEDFTNNRLLQDAIILRIILIGEAVKKLPDIITTKYPNIPWRKLAGIRDKLVHSYFGRYLKEINGRGYIMMGVSPNSLFPIKKTNLAVIPAKAGIQEARVITKDFLDSRFHGNDIRVSFFFKKLHLATVP